VRVADGRPIPDLSIDAVLPTGEGPAGGEPVGRRTLPAGELCRPGDEGRTRNGGRGLMGGTFVRQLGIGDFDFLVGRWDVVNRRLISPLSGVREWDEFPATVTCRGSLMGGGAVLDEIHFPTKNVTSLTLRLYDVERDEWSLHFANSQDGVLRPPVRGRFHEDGRGEFHGDDTHEGRRIRCRFLWFGITADKAHWEQAFSVDGGRTWETNWTMEYTRVQR
jgi:hypothetical protein